jgi:hypothetical protein
MYVPYNAYKLNSNQLKYKDLLKPQHINQDHARYELHRVWVVDSTLKAGTDHVYKRRTLYVDESAERRSAQLRLHDPAQRRGLPAERAALARHSLGLTALPLPAR